MPHDRTPPSRPKGAGSAGRHVTLDNEDNPSGQSQRGRDMMDEPGGGTRPNQSERQRRDTGRGTDADAPGTLDEQQP